jgi:hypothetical protein
VQYVHPPEDVRLAPYIFFCLDDAFKSKPIRVYLKNQQQQRSVRLGNNEPEPFRIKETLSIKFEDVVIDESCPFVQ